jgi:hypothetical protein
MSWVEDITRPTSANAQFGPNGAWAWYGHLKVALVTWAAVVAANAAMASAMTTHVVSRCDGAADGKPDSRTKANNPQQSWGF